MIARDALLDQLRKQPRGEAWSARYVDWLDRLVAEIFLGIEDIPPNVAVVAVGGYGRRQMAPWSDLDLAIVTLDEHHPGLDPFLRLFRRRLQEGVWDRYRIAIDYAYRPISDAAGLDLKSRTGFLDGRVVVGPSGPHDAFQAELAQTAAKGDFLIEKIREREEALRKSHDTPYTLHPDLKDGAGGMRCLNTTAWIGHTIGIVFPPPREEAEFLLLSRNVLHLVAGSKHDRLGPQRQVEVAEALSLPHAEFMRQILEAMAAVHASYRSAIQQIREARFDLAPGVLARHGEVVILPTADTATAAFSVAHAHSLGLGTPDWPLTTSQDLDGERFIRALALGSEALRAIERSGLLRKAIPELEACRTLLPDDLTHQYPVLEHSLRTAENLLGVAHPWLGDLWGRFDAKPALVLAALLHDVGKQIAHQGHAAHGAEMSDRICRRLDLEPENRDLVAWLVRSHLEMARTLRLRDLSLPETITAFAEEVRTPERLIALTLLTWADTLAVAKDQWTQMQDGLLWELFDRTMATLTDGQPQPTRAARRTSSRADDASLHDFLDAMPAHYPLTVPEEDFAIHAALVDSLTETEPIQIHTRREQDLNATQLTVCTYDAPGVLAQILGVLYALDLSVTGVRAFTSAGQRPVALDTFIVTFNNAPIPASTLARLETALVEHLGSDAGVAELVRRSGKDPDRVDPVQLSVMPGPENSIVEVRASRSRGLAYRLSRRWSQQGWNIQGARIGQWAGQGAAAFYLEGTLAPESVRAAVEAGVSSPSSP